MLEAARSAGHELPIVYGNARDCSCLIAWALVRSIEVAEDGTTYRTSDLHPIEGRSQQELALARTGKAIAKGFIRPYAIIETPGFLDASVVEADTDRPDELIGLEGEELLSVVRHRRRERRLRQAKLDEARNHAALCCEVPGCGFDFARAYGPLGVGFAEVHHLQPLKDRAEPGETRLEDLAVVCANCHRMIHRHGASRPLGTLIPGR